MGELFLLLNLPIWKHGIFLYLSHLSLKYLYSSYTSQFCFMVWLLLWIIGIYFSRIYVSWCDNINKIPFHVSSSSYSIMKCNRNAFCLLLSTDITIIKYLCCLTVLYTKPYNIYLVSSFKPITFCGILFFLLVYDIIMSR